MIYNFFMFKKKISYIKDNWKFSQLTLIIYYDII